MKAILTGVLAVCYLGLRTKKLWEVGGRNVPMLNRGDVVIVSETVALSLCRNSKLFTRVDASVEIDIEPLPDIVEENQGDVNVIDPAAEIYVDPALDTAFDAPLDHTAGNIPLNEVDAPKVEETPAPETDTAPVVEDAPKAEETPALETAPVVEETPAPTKPRGSKKGS
jgi:hypothetical protein